MTLVSGPLSTVTTTPSAVAQVNISINSPRTRGTGVMTPEVKTVAVTGGVFSSQIAPGPAVLTLLIGGRESAPIPILVDDVESQTLADVVDAARLASGETQDSLTRLVRQVFAARDEAIGESLGTIASARDEALGQVADAVDGELGDTVRSAQAAAVSAENKVDSYTPRVVALEAMGGLSPESPADGQTANLLLQPESLSRAALNQSYVSNDLTVSVADPRFGAVADWDGVTGTDNTAAIRAAISHARSLGTGAVLLYPQGSGKGYYVSGTIEHGADLSVDMRAPIYHPGGTVTVRFGSTGKLTDNTAEYTIRVQRTTQSDWTDPADVGAELINMARCRINIPLAHGFTTNIRFIGDGQGFVACTTTLGLFLNGQCGLDLHARNGGWVNSNLLLGGYFLNHLGLNKGKPRCAVKYSSNWEYYNDGNSFIGLVAELKVDDAEGAEVEIIRAEYAQSNNHENVRAETSGPITIRNLNDSRFNNASLAYSQATVGGGMDNTNAVRDTGQITELRALDRTSAMRSIWRVDEMHKKAANYNGTTSIHVPGVSWCVSGNANTVRSMTAVEVQTDYLRVTSDRAVGAFISTRDVKRLLLTAHTAPTAPGRWVIKAFDATGAPITDPAVVKRGAVVSMSYTTFFGGSWITAIGTPQPVDFTVSTAVDHVWVGLSGEAGNSALVSAIEVLTSDTRKVRTWQPWDDRGMNWAIAAPTIGTYEVGRTVMNVAPAPGQPLGWVCTAAGSPGTWTPMQSLVAA